MRKDVKVTIKDNLRRLDYYNILENDKKAVNPFNILSPGQTSKKRKKEALKRKIIGYTKTFAKRAGIITLALGLILIGWSKIYASLDIKDILDNKIEKFCNKHEQSENKYWKEKNGTRCTLILQGMIRHETLQCTVGNGLNNNCFGFRGGNRKDWREKYGMIASSYGSYIFPDKTKSIEFAVDRYYKYDKYKTIKQIIEGGCYVSPEDGIYKCFPGFARTTRERYDNYIYNVKEYYKTNKI